MDGEEGEGCGGGGGGGGGMLFWSDFNFPHSGLSGAARQCPLVLAKGPCSDPAGLILLKGYLGVWAGD